MSERNELILFLGASLCVALMSVGVFELIVATRFVP
jgi:hypothetical protein